jgi:hypothetical protein
MKLDRGTLVLGAVFIGAAVILSARQERRPPCAGGACCPLPSNFSVLGSDAWTAVESSNPPSGVTAGALLTNRQQ